MAPPSTIPGGGGRGRPRRGRWLPGWRTGGEGQRPETLSRTRGAVEVGSKSCHRGQSGGARWVGEHGDEGHGLLCPGEKGVRKGWLGEMLIWEKCDQL